MKKAVLVLLLTGVVIPLAWILVYKYEGAVPEISVHLPSDYLKNDYVMELKVTDAKTGLRQVRVSLMQKGNEKVLLDNAYPSDSLFNFLAGPTHAEDSFSIPIESRKYGMADGEAIIQILVTDQSWRGWNTGNRFYEERKVIIDTQPPKIKVLTRQHNLARGGSGLVVYQVFEPDTRSGVRVGDNFFPGHSGLFDDPSMMTAFFALDHTQGPGTRIKVEAQDLAGNIAQRGFHHYIRDKNFRSDVLNISDGFLESKMPDIDLGAKEGEFSTDANPLLAKFLYVNKTLRQQNVEKVLSMPAGTRPEMMWQGRFKRLAGAANRAQYADRRVYKYKGKEIDRATHLGADLASTANAAVAAGNSGRIIMAEDVGIFGKTVIIDHGFGLASLYSHLSEMHVAQGDVVTTGDIIGKTGLTGLAGGDHLHFSMIVHNRFVNPVEWWDPNWIKHNITDKIAAVKNDPSLSGQ